jgi:hypothetical protein
MAIETESQKTENLWRSREMNNQYINVANFYNYLIIFFQGFKPCGMGLNGLNLIFGCA